MNPLSINKIASVQMSNKVSLRLSLSLSLGDFQLMFGLQLNIYYTKITCNVGHIVVSIQ